MTKTGYIFNSGSLLLSMSRATHTEIAESYIGLDGNLFLDAQSMFIGRAIKCHGNVNNVIQWGLDKTFLCI